MNTKKSLVECYNDIQNKQVERKYLSDKGTDHSYIHVYESLLNDYTYKPINFLEIGISYGSCLEMWTNYFDQNSVIFGLDIVDIQIFKDFGRIYYGDSKSEEVRDKFFKDEIFDVIIEDGEHTIPSQIKTFEVYYPKLKSGGIYIIEDIQNCESDAEAFRNLGYELEVIDLRRVKNRHDDVLFIFRKS